MQVDGIRLEHVSELKYLGCVLNVDDYYYIKIILHLYLTVFVITDRHILLYNKVNNK